MLCYTGNHKGPAGTWIIITELLSFVNIILNKYFANITGGGKGAVLLSPPAGDRSPCPLGNTGNHRCAGGGLLRRGTKASHRRTFDPAGIAKTPHGRGEGSGTGSSSLRGTDFPAASGGDTSAHGMERNGNKR